MQTPKKSAIKYFELIENSNLLLFLVILIVLIFLAVCCFIFYNAFYPDGIPEHLKEDAPSENSDDEDKDKEKMEGDDMMAMMGEEPAKNGNGTELM